MRIATTVLTSLAALFFVAALWAQDGTAPATEDAPAADAPAAGDAPQEEAPPVLHPDPPGCKRLSPKYDVWIDPVKKRVVMMGNVVLREGQLELFACLTGTKEHEAVVAVRTEAMIVHAALLAIGAEAGGPVEFLPEYKPPRGSEIEVTVHWTDPVTKERKKCRAQDWIRDVKTGKAMPYKFVFSGSGFWDDPEQKKRYYLAEDGDFICVANFPSAMLDVPVQSTQSNEGLLFDAFTDRIPPKDTEVALVLTVKAPEDKKADEKDAKNEKPAANSSQ